MLHRPVADGPAESTGNARRMALNADAASELKCSEVGEISGAMRYTDSVTSKRGPWCSALSTAFLIATCLLLSKGVTVIAAHAQPYPEARMNMSAKPFNFRHFESLPKDRRVEEAQAEVDRLFPPGSNAAEFESYFKASGAKCARGTDYYGPYITCIYHMQGLSLVSTDWTVGAYLEGPDRSTIKNVQVSRYLTGP